MKDPIMSYEEIQKFIPSIQDFWTRTFIATQYFCAARVGELVKHYHKPNTRSETGYWTHGLEYERIKELEDAWIVTIPNFKQKNIKALKQGFFVKSIEPWLREILQPLFKENTTGQVFPFGREKARKLIKQEIGKLGFDSFSSFIKTFSSHNLRHTRADHLKKIYGFDEVDLKKYLGLSSLKNVEHYVKSDVSFLIQKMKQKQFL